MDGVLELGSGGGGGGGGTYGGDVELEGPPAIFFCSCILSKDASVLAQF
jgi:hypothetical protein